MKPGREPTLAEANAYLEAAAKHFGAVIIEKDDAINILTAISPPIGVVIRGLVSVIGDSGFHVFDYAVLPKRWTPSQRIWFGSHELRHIVELDSMGWPAYYSKYLMTQLGRADLEANGYACDMEMRHALTGVIPTLDQLDGAVDNPLYLLDTQSRALTKKKLEQRAASLQAGAQAQSPVAVWGIAWLRANIPDLLATP